jgi:hypothetical protein
VVDLLIHCNPIQTRCNAIQTILQLNSNNYTNCAFQNYFAVAGYRGIWRDMAGFISPKFRESDPSSAELIFSAARTEASK